MFRNGWNTLFKMVQVDNAITNYIICIRYYIYNLCFNAPGDKDLPLELPPLMAGGQTFHLADQLIGLFPGDEPGGLHRIHQQLELGQFKGP